VARLGSRSGQRTTTTTAKILRIIEASLRKNKPSTTLLKGSDPVQGLTPLAFGGLADLAL
jgi:hypothetical protein